MMRCTVGTLIDATGARLLQGARDVLVEGVELDSRKVKPGTCFVALKGERQDGNAFADAALKAGASVVVLTKVPEQDTLVLAASLGSCVLEAAQDDGEAFMLAWAEAWRKQNPQWCVVGVTGSVGKTTTKDMLAAALGATRTVHATKGNFNNLLGVPLTLLSCPKEAELVVVEMGMNHPGEITRLAKAAKPNVAVITNVGTSHIGILGSRENIARAKAEIISGLTPKAGVDGCLVLTGEDDFTGFIEKTFAKPAGVCVVHVGSAPTDDVHFSDVRLNDEGLPSFEVSFAAGDTFALSLPLPGKQMAQDAVSALAVVERLGLNKEAALAALAHMPATHMRLEVTQTDTSARVIDDSYNASPSSMAAALDVLCSMRCEGRRVAVLGEMGELGQEELRLHQLVGAYAAAKPIDLLVIIGSSPCAAALKEAATTMGFSADHLECFATVDDALATIVPILTPQDLVLVKASRAAGLDVFAKGVLTQC